MVDRSYTFAKSDKDKLGQSKRKFNSVCVTD